MIDRTNLSANAFKSETEDAQTGNGKRLFKLVGGALPPVSAHNDNNTNSTDPNDYDYNTPGSPKLITICIGQEYTGWMENLVLVNDDNTVNDGGVGESYFKNIRIYEHPQTAASVSPITFEQSIASPRIIGGTNEDLGVRIQDLNGDGLPDIAYNLLYGKSTGIGSACSGCAKGGFLPSSRDGNRNSHPGS